MFAYRPSSLTAVSTLKASEFLQFHTTRTLTRRRCISWPISCSKGSFVMRRDILTQCENIILTFSFFHLISCAGVGHGVGAYGRGVGGNLPVGARSCQFTATDWTEPGSTLGKVNNPFCIRRLLFYPRLRLKKGCFAEKIQSRHVCVCG